MQNDTVHPVRQSKMGQRVFLYCNKTHPSPSLDQRPKDSTAKIQPVIYAVLLWLHLKNMFSMLFIIYYTIHANDHCQINMVSSLRICLFLFVFMQIQQQSVLHALTQAQYKYNLYPLTLACPTSSKSKQMSKVSAQKIKNTIKYQFF